MSHVTCEVPCCLPRCLVLRCWGGGLMCHDARTSLPLCPLPSFFGSMSDSPGSVLKRRMLNLKGRMETAVAPQIVIWNVPGTAWLQGSENERNVNASRLLKALRGAATQEVGEHAVAVTDSGFFCHESVIHIANRRDGQEGWNCIVVNAPTAEARDALFVPVMRDSTRRPGFEHCVQVHTVTLTFGQLSNKQEQPPSAVTIEFVQRENFFKTWEAVRDGWREGAADGLTRGLAHPKLVPRVQQTD